jgi:predicted metal-dependent phosphoesterase TrpH
MRADLHVHSSASYDGLHSVRLLAKYAAKKRFDAIGICDHDAVHNKKAQRGNPLILYGQEASCAEGHMLVYNYGRRIARHAPAIEVVEAVLAENGICIPAHAFSLRKPGMRGISQRIGATCVEKFNGTDLLHNIAALERIANGTGGSDAHAGYEIGNAYTVFDCDPVAEQVYEALRRGAFAAVWSPNVAAIIRRYLEKV